MKKKNRLTNILGSPTHFYSTNYHKIVLKNRSQEVFSINVLKNSLNFLFEVLNGTFFLMLT